MKIALTIEDFRPSRGGGEAYAFGLARALAALGHEVHVFAARIGDVPEGVTPHVVAIYGAPWRRTAFALRCARMLADREGDFDLVHGLGKSIRMDVFRPGGGVHRAWQRQDPLSIEGRGRRLWRRVKGRLSLDQCLVLRLEAKQYAPGPDGPEIIANSGMVRDHILTDYRVAEDRIHVIYNGVDTKRFSPANREKFRSDVREEFGIEPSATVLLFAANNFRLKGLTPLVRAAGELGDVREPLRVLVIGRGRPARYRRLARELGCDPRFVFAGPMPAPERAYAAADVLVHPSFYDPCANVTLEALASGLPVVTSIYNGAGEIITGGAEGSVVDPQDIGALAAAIRAFLDPARREAAGKAARTLAEQHTMSHHVRQVLAVYGKALARKAR